MPHVLSLMFLCSTYEDMAKEEWLIRPICGKNLPLLHVDRKVETSEQSLKYLNLST